MKSVVVEASTVAKAVETAWLKAEKPEEFFIRVLQEHQSGFLGFGSQKAKIVLFFKNSQKSDSLFPTILKQKEYANLFDNAQLKTPTQFNVVDVELNKNLNLGQQKNKSQKIAVQSTVSPTHVNKTTRNLQKVGSDKLGNQVHGTQQKRHQEKVEPEQKQEVHKQNKQKAAQPKSQNTQQTSTQKSEQHHQSDKNGQQGTKQQPVKKQHDGYITKKVQQPTQTQASVVAIKQQASLKKEQDDVSHVSKMRLELQVVEKQAHDILQVQSSERKEDVVKDIARALKKVQSQKIVSNVSRQIEEKHRIVAPKKVEAQENVVMEKVVPRVVQKFKRRPLSTDFIENSTALKSQDKVVSEFNTHDLIDKDKIK